MEDEDYIENDDNGDIFALINEECELDDRSLEEKEMEEKQC